MAVSFHWSSRDDLGSMQVMKAVVVSPDAVSKPKRKKSSQPEEKSTESVPKKKDLAAEKKRKEIARRKFDEARRKESAAALSEALQQEEAERIDAEKAARAASLVDEFKAAIRQKVSRNWVRPPGAPKWLKCVVQVRLVPSGDVLSAQVVRSSGNSVFDRSVENAVYKAAPLPIPRDAELFDYFREIEFLFNPED